MGKNITFQNVNFMVSLGAFSKRTKWPHGAKCHNLGHSSMIFGNYAQYDKRKQTDFFFEDICFWWDYVIFLKRAKRALRGQKSQFNIHYNRWYICARSGPPQLGVVLVLVQMILLYFSTNLKSGWVQNCGKYLVPCRLKYIPVGGWYKGWY